MTTLLLAALRERDASGRSTYIDLSQRDNTVRLIGDEVLAYQLTGREPEQLRTRTHYGLRTAPTVAPATTSG